MWADVVGYEQYYEVNTDGEIRSKRTGKIRKPVPNKNGYYMMILCGEHSKKG